MSRIGKKPIEIPSGVEIKVAKNDLDIFEVSVKGPKGTLLVNVPKGVSVEQAENQLSFKVKNEEAKSDKALWGLSRTLVNNAVLGVMEGFSKVLEINGVGYKVALQGKKLVLNVGFSHQVEFAIPEGITAEVEKNKITISGIDKQQVGQIAAEIRAIKKPEPYKGKGIKYIDEQIRRKAGKVVKS
ncbi:50S ribosomal protein L6 [Candidatus Parcubacteria bacterium]|jgi:large subunit ribosomal protein L6|nr:50S ribosomal protein L6 [Candidatus Parcubacteria bacterium]